MRRKRATGAKPAPAPTEATPGGVATFDPWSASYDEAERWQAAQGYDDGPGAPIYQWVAAQTLSAGREQIEHGTGFDVLAAVADCALHSLAMPPWLADAFLRRYRHVQRLRGKSWDDDAAFGVPYPGKAQIAAMRRRQALRLNVWNVVTDYVKAFPTAEIEPLFDSFGAGRIDRGLPPTFADRVRRIGCVRSTAWDRYNEACSLYGLPHYKAIRARLGVGVSAESAQVTDGNSE